MSRFSSLKVSEIQSLLTAIGARTSGRKVDLLDRLNRELAIPKLKTPIDGRPTRILSVDMGIKNLAFCVCDVKKDDLHSALKLDILEWKRVAVVDDDVKKTSETNKQCSDEPFGPSILSKAAMRLVHDQFWPHKADAILVERQRFRSGGGSAVQEWTLRVNMLESMIWAIATALGENSSSKYSPSMWPVNPKQVATFWVRGDVPEGGRTSARNSKIEKKQKIDLVHKWLSAKGEVDGLSLNFLEGAEDMKRAFLASHKGKKAPAAARKLLSNNIDTSVTRIPKLDDLSDCLLQVAAWCKWEQNRNSVALDTFTADEVPNEVAVKPEQKRRRKKSVA